MSVSPDLRRVCNGSKPPSPNAIGCFGNYIQQFDNVYIMNNVTKVLNYNTLVGGYIDPYAVAEQTTAPDCSPYNNGGCSSPCVGDPCYCCGGFGVTNNNLPCWPLDPTKYQACVAGDVTWNIGNYHNCFHKTNVTYSIQKCHQIIGWKALAGYKAWQGRKAYTSREVGFPDSLTWCAGCTWHNEDTTPDTTKYLSMSGDSSTTLVTSFYNCSTVGDCTTCTLDHITTQTAAASNAVRMDKFGNSYVDTCSSGSSGYDPGADHDNIGPAATAFGFLAEGNGSVYDNFTRYSSLLTTKLTALGAPSSISGAGNNWTIEWSSSYSCFDGGGILVSTTDVVVLRVILTATTYDLYTFDNKPAKSCCVSDGACDGGSCTSLDIIQTSHLHYEYSATTYHSVRDTTGIGSISFDQTYNETVNGSLATPYTQQQAKDDRNNNLMSTWDIGLDYIYPWIYLNANTTNIPFVCYDEAPGQPVLGTCVSQILYTGQIKGAPVFVQSGDKIYIPDKVWDPYHENKCICDSLVSPGCRRLYTETWGANSTDVGVPCASQWVNYQAAAQLAHGAFDGCNFAFTIPSTCAGDPLPIMDDVLWGVKYAEILIPKQSYNYFRPCGVDRFAPTGSSAAHCIKTLTDHSITLDASSGLTTDIVSNDYVIVGNTGTMDGIWANTISDGAYGITLVEPRLISASALPSFPIVDGDVGICSKLRWQTLQPAICGRIDITAVNHSTGSCATCSLATPSYLVHTDQIEIVNSKGFADINGHHLISVIDSTHIGLLGTEGLPVSKSYLGGGQMYSTLAPDWRWSDQSTKGNYLTFEYGYNFRDVGEWGRLEAAYTSSTTTFDCLSFTDYCTPGSVPAQPRPHQSHCGLSQYINSFTPTANCIEYTDCVPAVAYFSPNNESFVNGTNHGFGNAIADSQYGAQWRGLIRQNMDDPLFETPPCPCEDDGFGNFNCSNFSWDMDDGQCINDYIDVNSLRHKLYPHVNQYEAEIDVPQGAPPLPPNVYINYAKLTDFTSDELCPTGKVQAPPIADANAIYDNPDGCSVYKNFPWATPWLTYLYEYNCECSEGRFQDQYATQGISCDAVVPPP